MIAYAKDTIYDLSERWESILEDLREEEFDAEDFQTLATDTYEFLFPLNDGESDIPRDIISFLFLLNEFAAEPVSVSEKCDLAQCIAGALCLQFVEGWVETDGKPSKEKFMFEDGDGNFCIVRADTFDLSDVVML